jgi:hypothetical protein
MNKSVTILGKKIYLWILVAGMVVSSSLAIAVQPVGDEKIHIQDTTGKIETNVPVAASRAFSPLAVEFNNDSEPEFDRDGDGFFNEPIDDVGVGSTIQTKQKVVVNFVADVSTAATVKFHVNNLSEDSQIFLIKAGSTPHMMLDMNSGDDVTIQGITGHNEWLATIAGGVTDVTFTMEASTTDAGSYPIVVELERVG